MVTPYRPQCCFPGLNAILRALPTHPFARMLEGCGRVIRSSARKASGFGTDVLFPTGMLLIMLLFPISWFQGPPAFPVPWSGAKVPFLLPYDPLLHCLSRERMGDWA